MSQGKDLNAACLPSYARALISSLQFAQPSRDSLRTLSDDEWRRLLHFSDESQLTLLFGHNNRFYLPSWVAERIEGNLSDNSTRFNRLTKEAAEITRELNRRSITFALLKGFTHAEHFIADARLRSQGDIDLWCQPERVFEANAALTGLGYRPIGKSRGRHLDPLIRESEWKWTGNYFAPELPIPVDLHYQLWDRAMERLPGPAETEVWERLCPITVGDGQVALQLHLTDAFAFACLHLLMHLLHGDLRLQRAWEIASFLQNYSRCDAFWKEWKTFYADDVRRMQTTILLLCRTWFGCRLPAAVLDEARSLPPNVSFWIQRFAWSPVESLFSPNKDELWLNLSLLTSTRDKFQVSARRLFPVHAIDGRTNAETEDTDKIEPSRNRALAKIRFISNRSAYHLAALPKTVLGAIGWWWSCQELGRDFVLFALASGIFDFGEFIFFVLYNLYLLHCGFDEKSIGQIASALTAGTFVGAIPASIFMRKFGLSGSLKMAVAGTAVAGALRVIYVSYPAAVAGAFLNGASMAFWAVSLPPVVASLSNARNRTLAFSIVTSIGIGVGALAGVAGASLPKLLMHFDPHLTPLAAERTALLCGCAFVALSLLPAALLKVQRAPDAEGRKVYPRARFAWFFLLALFIWSLGTGGFNPLFNVYFAQHLHVAAQQIGFIFSLSQLAQVIAILLVPLTLRSLGQSVSIVALQIGTALLLVGLAFAVRPETAAILYISYMSFQYASEPCLLSMLMTGVRQTEQRGASALYYMVTSLAGVLAASAAGAVFQQFGYQPALLACAVLTVIAALVLYRAPLQDRLQILTPK